MIYSILQTVNKGVEKPVRFSLNFLIGTVFYIVAHWLLFSSLGDKYAHVKKFRMVIYAIFCIDFFMFLKIRNTLIKEKSVIPTGYPPSNVKEEKEIKDERNKREEKEDRNKRDKREAKEESEEREKREEKEAEEEREVKEEREDKCVKTVKEVKEDTNVEEPEMKHEKRTNATKEYSDKQSEHVGMKKSLDIKSEASIPIYRNKRADMISVELPVYVSSKQKHIVKRKEERKKDLEKEDVKNIENTSKEIKAMNKEINEALDKPLCSITISKKDKCSTTEEKFDETDEEEMKKIMSDTPTQ